MENEKRSIDVGSLAGEAVLKDPNPHGTQAVNRRLYRDGAGMSPDPSNGLGGVADRQFETGAIRSEEMPYYAAIPYESIRRLALRATGAPRGEALTDDETGFTYDGGSRKYGYNNWRLGLPLRDTFNHVIQHLFRWITAVERGEVPPGDELSGAAWGIMLPLMTRERQYAAEARRHGFEAKVDAAKLSRGNTTDDLSAPGRPADSERVSHEQLTALRNAMQGSSTLTPKGERMREIATINREIAEADEAILNVAARRAHLLGRRVDLERGL